MRLAIPLLGILIGCGSNTASVDAYVPPVPDAAVPNPSEDAGLPDLAVDVSYPITLATWPGDSTVITACAKDMFGANLSGLVYEPATASSQSILWAVQNDPSKLHQMTWNGSAFVRVTTDGWITGKSLRYPGGTGHPDSEGMTRTDWASPEIYVVAERDNDVPDVLRQSILRYEIASTTKGVLDATHEWNLTSDLPATAINSGLEGIAWVPDTYLVGKGFVDESKQALYDPAGYPGHGTGVFFVSVDVTGMIYGYVLDLTASTFTRVASFSSTLTHAVDLTFDRENHALWALCDNACKGRMAILEIETNPDSSSLGRFVMRALVTPPKSLKDMNNEGFTMAIEAECTNNRKPFYWADDEETSGFAIRRATIACGRFY